MELSVSPDLDAFLCYLIVAGVGIVVAHGQVSSHMEGFKDIWKMVGTWFLFFLYFFIPLALYWLLDRTNAIQDTSLFAALLVGLGYKGILAGSNTTIQAPGGLSQIWSPLMAYANRTVDKIRYKARRNDIRMKNKLIAKIVSDTPKYAALEELGRRLTQDVATLNQSLAEIEQNADLVDLAKRERKAELLYLEVSATEDFLFEMREREIISTWEYKWYDAQLPSIIAAISLMGIIVIILFYVISNMNLPWLKTEYALWRLEKPNTSKIDQFRAAQRIATILNGGDENAKYGFAGLGEQLRRPELVLEQTDQVLNILLEHRCAAVKADVNLANILIKSLNTTNNDARSRIHRGLIYLSEKLDLKAIPVPDWNPSEGDSVTDLQRRIDQWQDYWDQYPSTSQKLPDCPEPQAPAASDA